jgi:leucyl aminopeptidase (aminopeptidase T)
MIYRKHLTLLTLVLALATTFACNSRETGSNAAESGAIKLDDGSATESSRDFGSMAEKVVTQSAGVKNGDVVLVFGSDGDLPLLEEIALAVRKRGASPLVTVSTIGFNRRTYDEVPAQYDGQVPEVNLKLAGIVDVIIGTEAGETRNLKDVPAERMAARSNAAAPVDQLLRKRGVRTVILGNGLYPSDEQAELYGLDKDELAEAMYSGIDADYGTIQAAGKHVKQVLAAGKELRITQPNGTDLRLRIDGRPVAVNDGIISPEEQKPGSAETSVWLPAGEVYLVPVAGTAQGTLVSDKEYYLGQPIEELELEFMAGKLTSMTARSGLDRLKAAYDAAGPGKDLLSVIDIGINPSLKVPDDNPIHAWSKAGRVTVVIGNNTWAGGTNQVNFAFGPSASKATIMVDGKPLVQDGKLLLPSPVAQR